MQFCTRTTDINALLLAPLQAVLRDVQKLLDMELDTARIEEADEDAPFDLQTHVFAASAFGQPPQQSGKQTSPFAASSPVELKSIRVESAAPADAGPIPAAFGGKPPESSQAAPVEPTASSAAADASASTMPENRSVPPPYSVVSAPSDLKAAVEYSKTPFALSLSKGEPISAWPGVALSGKPSGSSQAAPIEPTVSSAAADASASTRPENRSTPPPYTAVSVPMTSGTADSDAGPVPAWPGVGLSDKPSGSSQAAPIEPTVSSAAADASSSIRPENRSAPPLYTAISVPMQSATVDFEGGASIPISSGIALSRKPANALLSDRPESAMLAVSPSESADSKPTLPPIKATVPVGDIHRMTVAETGLSVATVASVENLEPYSRRALGIPLRPRNDSASRLSLVAPDHAHRRETEAAARWASAVEPSFQQAYRLTQTQLEERTAPEAESQSLVRNTFNVTVALSGNDASEGADKTALEEALTDILLAAARRHGLEI